MLLYNLDHKISHKSINLQVVDAMVLTQIFVKDLIAGDIATTISGFAATDIH